MGHSSQRDMRILLAAVAVSLCCQSAAQAQFSEFRGEPGLSPVRNPDFDDTEGKRRLSEKLVDSEWHIATNGLTMFFEAEGRFGVSDWGKRRGIWMAVAPNRIGGVGYAGRHTVVVFDTALSTGQLYVDGVLFSKVTPSPTGDNLTTLVGLTRNKKGQLGLARIDTKTGQATQILELPSVEPDFFSLSFDAASGRFLTASIKSAVIGIIDPKLKTFTKVPLVGLPEGQHKIAGITCEGQDRVLVSFGPSGGTHENRVAVIDLTGKVIRISPDLGLGDRDFLCWIQQTEQLLAVDFNGQSPRIAAVHDAFVDPAAKRLGNPPRDSHLVDLAVTAAARMFTVRQGTNELVEVIDGDRLVTIGRFNTEVVGITSVPDNWEK